uniref:Nidogen 2 n=1 Tax=Callorhinchus milii TaxID=7868 RepID=A0A4W3IAE2_CALMI
MPDRGFVLLLKLHCILSSVHALQREDLFPFGPHRGDLILGEGDDETSQVVKLKRPLMFYDTQFRSLYVGTNGIISTQDFPMETQYVDDGFPTDFPVIAAYLSDIDTSRGRGRIFYRADDSPDILHRAAREIRRGFPRSSFSPSDAFIATWENVAPYEEVTRSSPSSNRFNTFQAVLAFDESNTYAIFLYPEDGLQFFGTRPKESYNVQIELPARVGFSRGETEYIQWKRDEPYYSLTSNEQSVKNLYQMGNSGTRGVWIFHIGGASQFNNVMQAQAGEKPSRENIVTLDSTLNGPVKLHIPEPDYPEVDDYDEEFDEDDDETFDFSPLAPTDPRERVHNIPEQPPYPDAGIIPPHPEGYPEAGVVSSYPEARGLPLYPERYQEAGSSNPQRYSEADTRQSYPARYPNPGETHPERYPNPEATHPERYPNPGATHPERYPNPGATHPERYPNPGATHPERYPNPGATHPERYPNPGATHPERYPNPGGQCSQYAYCADYSSGFCCHCHSGYYGNGRQCLVEGTTQRVNGKVNGKLVVGASRTPVEIRNADLHAYVVVSDGRAYTAISHIPESVGWALQPLSAIGGLFGWLFALQQPGFKNGFSVAGAKFIRNVDITFYPGNERLNIIQVAQGLDTQSYLSVIMEIEGQLPVIPRGASVQIQPYREVYHRSNSVITSKANREYSVLSSDGETQTLRYDLRQNITYHDCEHSLRTFPTTQQLNVARVFVLYDQKEKAVRYAMTNEIGSVEDDLKPEHVNPCYDGSHDCDVSAQCFPGSEQAYICRCAEGYQGDGKVCTDIDECADGGHYRCGSHATCLNLPGLYRCECHHGYQFAEDGRTCVRKSSNLISKFVDKCAEGRCHPAATCYNIPGSFVCQCNPGYEGDGLQCRPVTPDHEMTACEHQRERLQAEYSSRGDRPHFTIHIPQCDEHGNFRPLQCHGSIGQCWCVNERGQEIPGSRTFPGTDQPQCGLPEPTTRPQTLCERWRQMSETSGTSADQYVPQCDEYGNFSPMQCRGNRVCWCVDKDGREIQGTGTQTGILPACIPTVAPPTVQPTPSSLVTTPSTGTFLLYAQGQHIGYLPLNGTQLNTEGAKSLLALHGSIVIGIDYDCREKMVYWTDVAGRTINRISLEIGAEPEIMINSGLTSPEGLTIDYLRRLMFWTDSGSDKIEVAKVDGTHRRVLFDTDLVNPRAIVVDSLSGNLYWTDWNREAPKIETSYIDGTNRRVLVKDDIGLPNGLTFDPFSLQLCWADAGTKNLECIFPDGTGRHVVQLGLNYPFSIVAYSNHFYYTDWRRDGVIVVNKANGQTTDEFLPDQRSHLYGITVAYPSCPHGKEP